MQMTAPRGAIALEKQHGTYVPGRAKCCQRHYHHAVTQCCDFLSKMQRRWREERNSSLSRWSKMKAPQEVFISHSQPARCFSVVTWENKSIQLWTFHPPFSAPVSHDPTGCEIWELFESNHFAASKTLNSRSGEKRTCGNISPRWYYKASCMFRDTFKREMSSEINIQPDR